ncbi:hypothetical protein RHS03_08765, partial [Rhizoctonia solani]
MGFWNKLSLITTQTTLIQAWPGGGYAHTSCITMSLERLPDNASPKERAVLEQLSQNVENCGTLLTMAKLLHGKHPIIKPSTVPSNFIDLRSLDKTGNIYLAVLGFAQAKWPHQDLSLHRSQSNQYALILTAAGRWPVKIRWHFQVEVLGEVPKTCTLVSQLNMDNIPLLPWSLYADDLGYYVANNNSFHPIEAVSPNQLVLPVVTGQFEMRGSAEHLQIIVAYDCTGSKLFDITEMDWEEGGGDYKAV